MTGMGAWRAPLALALLAAAAWVAGPGASPPRHLPPSTSGDHLRRLGSLEVLVSTWLGIGLLQEAAGPGGLADLELAESLLERHPDLDRVREIVAWQLVVHTAPRVTHEERYRALVERGLEVLEEGLVHGERPALHASLGRLLVHMCDADPRFLPVAEAYFGHPPEDVAIDELRAGSVPERDAALLANLLVARGLRALQKDRDLYRAERDLREAETLLGRLDAEDSGAMLHTLEALRSRWRAAEEDGRL